MEIGKKFAVFRSDGDAASSERIPIILGRGRAFGSGEHETTYSCLEELEKLPVASMEFVLDLGCGTGILAIAAARMGARSVTAIDPNPFAVQTAEANIKLNCVDERTRAIRGELRDAAGSRFDLIMANLYGDVLMEIAQDILLFLKPGGYLLLSGIHYEYHYEIKAIFLELGLRLLRNRVLEEYATLLFERQSSIQS